MTSAPDSRPLNIGMYINPLLDRRAGFQIACRDMFHSLQLEASVAAAAPTLGRQRIDLLVLDLQGFNRSKDLIALGELVRNRGGAPTLVLCPFSEADWIPELMAFGSLQYLIMPSATSELQQTVRQALQQIDKAPGQEYIEFQLLAKEKELRELLVIQRSLQRALADTDDAEQVAEQVCLALCSFPGVRHTALLHRRDGGELHLAAQESRNHLDLLRLLDGAVGRLEDTPLREVFPGLVAAANGALVLLDSPEKAGHPEMAVSLHDKDVHMVLAIPLTRNTAGVVQGALCMMFDRSMQFSREQFACFASLAQLVSFGLAMSELKQHNDVLLSRLTHSATTDALTGAANRSQGEHYLSREIGRARRYELPLALITFDLDPPVRGQAGGAEHTLKTVVAATQAKLRGADSLVRMGDAGFLIIAPHTAATAAVKMAEKLRDTVAHIVIPGGDGVSICLGVAQLGAEETGEDVMQRAGEALHRAQQAGRNRVELALQ